MPSIALISSGFLRNYKFFTRSAFFRRLVTDFKCDVYLSVWDEDGYGTNASLKYTTAPIPTAEIRNEFGGNLKSLTRHSFAVSQPLFTYAPVQNLLRDEPYVLEKYRSRFYCLRQAFFPAGYDAYLHTRFDMVLYPELENALLETLANYKADRSPMITSADLYHRAQCFGDTFQIGSYNHMRTLQQFFSKLYDPAYLGLDIPTVPERVLDYFADQSGIAREQLPLSVQLNREVWVDPT